MEGKMEQLSRGNVVVVVNIIRQTAEFFRLMFNSNWPKKSDELALADFFRASGKIVVKFQESLFLIFTPETAEKFRVEISSLIIGISGVDWQQDLKARYPELSFSISGFVSSLDQVIDLSQQFKTAAEPKTKTPEELAAEVETLKKQVEELKKRPAQVVHHYDEGGGGGMLIKYGLPNAERAHLLVFSDGSKEILPDESTVNAWINDQAQKQPVAIWQMRKRSIVPA